MNVYCAVIATNTFEYEVVVDRICGMNWSGLTKNGLTRLACAYYYFSIQFRENLEIALDIFPNDEKLHHLHHEECNTANLSPWPGVAAKGERMNHDEFMRRTLQLSSIHDDKRNILTATGEAYLDSIRRVDPMSRALSIASYEDGGLERVFGAFLQSKNWDGPLLLAFRHFLTEHIRFDSDAEKGHGALSRHLTPNDRILPLWAAFNQLLVASVPELEREVEVSG